MGNFTGNSDHILKCDALLMQACKTYLQIEKLYEDVMGAISDTNSASMEKATDSLTGLLQDACRIDSGILENLGPAAELAESTQNLLQQREDILHRLYRSNRTLTNKAENIQSLIRHEIVGMSTNRNALKGYKPTETERKSIISSSF